jgi:hypothetical protein
MTSRLVFLLCLALAVPARAQIGTTVALTGDGCNVAATQNLTPWGPEGGSVFITVYGNWKAARFAAPLPDCVGITVTDVQVLHGYTMSGNLDDGIEISFNGCLPDGAREVLRIDYAPAPTQVECCPYPLLPHPGFGQIQLVDCNDNVVVPAFTTRLNFVHQGWLGDCGESFAFPAQDPVPPDASSIDATTARLAWDQYGWVGCVVWGFHTWEIYFGTTPDPPLVATRTGLDFYQQWYDVGPLQPETTYYWRIGGVRDSRPIESPVWSFTVTEPVATTPTTWGRVKALYRD